MAAKHAEIIFETGEKSVVQYDDEAELQGFVQEHVRRAKSGEKGGPTGHPAERISKVLLYDSHPGSLGEGGKIPVSSVQSLIDGLTYGDSLSGPWIDVNELISALRREINATNIGDVGAHDSLYKMSHTSELSLDFLNDGNDGTNNGTNDGGDN